MANKAKFQAIKGTRDLLPPETELWNRVEATAREVFSTYGFGEIRPPIFEPTELFARAVGGETDIVSKEMYILEDRLPPEVESLRKYILRAAITAGDPERIKEFAHKALTLSWELRQLYEMEGIPQSTDNDYYVRSLEGYSRQASEEWKKLDFAIDEQAFRQVRAHLSLHLTWLELGSPTSLRPEATASVCRAYIEHNMNALTQPVRLYYTGPMFRRERPQKGRYRQFYQIGAEVLEAVRRDVFEAMKPGVQKDAAKEKEIAKDAAIDAEVIEMVMAFFARLEMAGVQLELNSIGHNAPECRRGYVEKLRAALVEVKDQLGEDSRRRIETNPLRVLDSKLEHEQAIIATLPRIADHLCDDCAKHYAEVKRQLEMRGVAFRENWRLVRGLDYYMRTTFEITAQGLGSQNAVCGGGRYDGLVELLGGPPTKGIGFAIGEDRLILSLQEAGKGGAAQGRDVYIAWMGPKAQAPAIAAARKLRRAGLRVELPPVEQKFGKALGQADKLGSRYALILGEDEVASGQWTLKTLADGSQRKIGEAELVEVLSRGKQQ